MPQLKTYANLWTLWDHPAPAPGEWTIEAKVAAVAAAGFDGVMGDAGTGVGSLAKENGLTFAAFQRLDERHDLHEALEAAKAEGAAVLQVHLGWHDTPADLALDLALRLDAASEAVGLPAVVETHRDTCTETPEKTEYLCDAFRKTTGKDWSLLVDLSHHAVVKHLDPPYSKRLLEHPDALRRVTWHHLRPFNGHHAQVPVLTAHGALAPEMGDWIALVRDLFTILHTSELAELWVCPELGPLRGGYALSSFPDSWSQAVRLRQILLELWEQTCPSPRSI